jgi:lipopolysaccharide biosynthesis regulator YciM
MFELLFLLLPVAVFYGYVMGSRQANKSQQSEKTRKIGFLTKGINYFLYRDKEKAVDEFIRYYDSDAEHSFEEGLALGALLRERGDLEKAIRFHNNLLTTARIEPVQRSAVLLELARDFVSSGLLNKAEDILMELISYNSEKKSAVRLLVTLYEQEKEWQRAIDLIDSFRQFADENITKREAEFYCELGNEAYSRKNYAKANDYFKKSASINKGCVRAYLNMAKIMIEIGQTKNALAYIQEAVNADPAMIPICLKSLAKCFYPGQEMQHLEVLNSWLQLSDSPQLVMAVADLIMTNKTPEEAEAFVMRLLKKSPSFELFSYILGNLYEGLDPRTQERFAVLKSIMDAHLAGNYRYMCQHCGFKSSVLFWQCPSCHRWEQMKPHQISEWGNTAVRPAVNDKTKQDE